MCELVGVIFRKNGNINYVHSDGAQYVCDEFLVVQSNEMLGCGKVVKPNFKSKSENFPETDRVIRRANSEDLHRCKKILQKEEDSKRLFKEKVKKLGLEMKLIDVQFSFDEKKVIFYFSTEGRVDFRELVKELAAILHTRIELRQIGVRDEARKLGGLGVCGQSLCCTRFLNDFKPVSIKMAKDQGLSLKSANISGMCGRLMCCLKYEQPAYEERLKCLPKIGSVVITPRGEGKIVDLNVLTGNLRVSLFNEKDMYPVVFHADEVQPKKDNTDAVE